MADSTPSYMLSKIMEQQRAGRLNSQNPNRMGFNFGGDSDGGGTDQSADAAANFRAMLTSAGSNPAALANLIARAGSFGTSNFSGDQFGMDKMGQDDQDQLDEMMRQKRAQTEGMNLDNSAKGLALKNAEHTVEAGGESNPMFEQQERNNVLNERARSAKREDLSNQLLQSQLTRAHSQEGGYKNAEDRAQVGLQMLAKILKQRFGI